MGYNVFPGTWHLPSIFSYYFRGKTLSSTFFFSSSPIFIGFIKILKICILYKKFSKVCLRNNSLCKLWSPQLIELDGMLFHVYQNAQTSKVKTILCQYVGLFVWSLFQKIDVLLLRLLHPIIKQLLTFIGKTEFPVVKWNERQITMPKFSVITIWIYILLYLPPQDVKVRFTMSRFHPHSFLIDTHLLIFVEHSVKIQYVFVKEMIILD